MTDKGEWGFSGGAAMEPAPPAEPGAAETAPVPARETAPVPKDPQYVEDPYKDILLPTMPVGEELMRNQIGQYQWIYEMSLLKDPTIFFLVWKIFFWILVGIFGFTMLVDLLQGWGGEAILNSLRMLGYFLIGMTVLVSLGYLIYAAIMGGKYIVKFTMDEEGVNHEQIPAQAEKARKIGMITTAVGAMTGNFTTMGVGMNASARTEMYSAFARVRKVKLYPRRGLIKLNGILKHNQVYVSKGDYEFVRDYILARCVNAKKKPK